MSVDVPAAVADLERLWSITVGAPFTGGNEAFVAEATLADGTPAVLKILRPRPGRAVEHEITALRRGGDACARLLRADEARNAMLLERLGPPLAGLGLPIERRREIVCDVVSRFWRPAAGSGLPTGAEKGRWLIDWITSRWESLARPCSEGAVAFAVACAERRIEAHDDDRAVLVHGDAHESNTLTAGDTFKLIDPDGLVAEPEYDLGVIMRSDPFDPAEPLGWAPWLAARTGLDVTAVWEWAAVERVSTGLACLLIGLDSLGREMLAAADQVAV